MAQNSGRVDFPGYGVPITDGDTGQLGTGWYQFLYTLWLRTGASDGDQVVPTGTVNAWPLVSTSIPAGWSLCDGSAISRVVYADLYAVLGTFYGAGDGSTTFNLPNFTGKFLLGVDGTHAIGTTGGASTLTIATTNLPSHDHPVTDPGHIHSVTDPGHFHASLVASSTNLAGVAAGTAVAGNTSSKVTGLTVNSNTTGITVGNTGSGTPLAALPPYATVNWMIKQ